MIFIYYNSNKLTECKTDKEKEGLNKKISKVFNKINHYEVELNILENNRWDPMDEKYREYLNKYVCDQMEDIVDNMRFLRNEHAFKSGYLFNYSHKGN